MVRLRRSRSVRYPVFEAPRVVLPGELSLIADVSLDATDNTPSQSALTLLPCLLGRLDMETAAWTGHHAPVADFDTSTPSIQT